MSDSLVHKFPSAGKFFESVKKIPSSPAILAPDRKPLSYGQLYRHIDHVLSLLNDYGLGRNDRIAIVLPNGLNGCRFFVCNAGAACAP
jgi:acyl-CoA synthetase (AMP-forming)/AMP-acid ligase II